MRFIHFLFLSLFFSSTVLAQIKGPDFDGDGLSDVVGFENQHDGSANELAFTSISSVDSLPHRNEFGKATESQVMADYDGDGITDLAVVGPDEFGNYVWRYKLSTGEGVETTDSFGKTGDLVFYGCSFDNDAKADRATIDAAGLFTYQKSTDLSIASFSIAAGLEHFLCADLDGDGIDEIIGQVTIKADAAKKTQTKRRKPKRKKKPAKKPVKKPAISGDRSYFYVWNLAGQKIQTLQFGKDVKDIIAIDSDGDGKKELGFVSEKSNSVKNITVHTLAGDKIYSLPYFDKAVAVNFSASPQGIDGLFLKTKTDTKFLKYPALSDPNTFQEVFISRTDTAITNKGVTTVGPVVSQETECTQNLEPNDGNEGFLWKPVSDTTGHVAVQLPAQYRLKNVRIIKNNQIVENLTYGGNGNGSRDLWRSARRYSTFDDNVTVIGSKGGVNYCWLIEDPSKRVD